MAFYPQFPAIYAYPMPFANQDFYAMYPPGAEAGNGHVYFDHPGMHGSGSPPGATNIGRHGHGMQKPGFNNRKESTDSGISDYSNFSANSRKTSNISSVSAHSLEESLLEDVKEETPYEEPDDDLCVQIVQQVEFYFSDANITKDKFLLKHVKRNKEGFVSLKLISSFKRVKHLTKDWRQVATAIERKSDKLEINDLRTKVRRLQALPEYDETTPSRTVVALNLPLERPTIEGVAEIFSACGDIVLIRILRPGNPIPADIKPFANKHPEMTAKVCALVEFERTEFALKAVRELNNEEEEEKMKVMELTAPPPKSTKNKDAIKKNFKLQSGQQGIANNGPQRRFSHAGFNPPPQHNPDQIVLGPRRRISLMHNMKFAPIDEEHKKNEFSLNPNAPTFQMQQQQQQHSYQQQRRLSRPSFVHPAHVAGYNMAMQQMQQMQPAPWMMRRLVHGDIASSGLSMPPNVLRMPRGPDKGKGFQHWCKNRMENNGPTAVVPKKQVSKAVPIVAPPEKKQQESEPVVEEEDQVVPADVAPVGAAKEEKEEAVVEVVEEVVAGAVAAAAVAPESCSDSGNEDGGLSEAELDLQDNERSR